MATIAYGAEKVVRDTPESFGNFQAGQSSRTPGQIVAHLGDLFDWALSLAKGQQAWHDSQPLPWQDEVKRFFESLKRFDDYLAGDGVLHASPDKLLQGPAADALKHVGQIAMLRRLAGIPIKAENYFVADIAAGQVGPKQPPARMEL
ncbi:MAG: hypothetical protein WCE52_15120 [Candidatus Acidiferrum sp.]